MLPPGLLPGLVRTRHTAPNLEGLHYSWTCASLWPLMA
jgi:hypothetical protein